MDKKEFEYILKKAEHGDAEAMYLLGLEYDLGEVVERDEEEALFWMNRSADRGNKEALEWLKDYFFDDDAAVQAHS